MLDIDEEKIREEKALDGYYMLLTSEMETSDDEIIDMYRGLWRIEESFKVTKSELEARPVYVWTKEHIETHFGRVTDIDFGKRIRTLGEIKKVLAKTKSRKNTMKI